MFSVIFPGQGSQSIGMGKEIHDKYQSVKELFKKANDILNFNLSKLIFEGPKNDLDLTMNTQPAIFLVSYSIFNVIKKEHNIDLNKANFFAGHSLGEYSALACAGYLNFSDALRILRLRGEAMQNSVPKGVGGMLAILGATTENIENIINENSNKFTVQIANDNSDGQIVVSGKLDDLKKMIEVLKTNSIKNIQLPVSAPFHCALMNKATEVMEKHINDLSLSKGLNNVISNVTAKSVSDPNEIKNLLIKQIENRVRWRESVINMIDQNTDQFIEIGPGKVLTGLTKRVNKNVKSISINTLDEVENLKV
ncbi:[acyl-carrier-protein] S-malonyltransferase [alpha proteobacterium HIMB5]|nr:[acyl-carrier-protein] S-malonyltransferase [alpha proteobacterium HIMB5]